jgi:N-acetyl-ornithine/N-acetyl-lysine deacetylase
VITEEQLERVVDSLEEILGISYSHSIYRERARQQEFMMEGERRPQGSPPNPSATPASTMTTEVALLHNMLAIPSYSGRERALAEYLVEQARQMGLQACVDDAGNFVASTVSLDEVDRDSRPVVLLGHMDTVRGNIPVRLQDGVLYGRGAVDAKGPLAAFLCAAARLVCQAKAGSLERPIVVIGAVEEEAATSRGARAVVERYQPLACIIGEPSGSQSMTIGYKGRLLVEYRVTRPIHHSAGPQQNSSEAAVRIWNRARDQATDWNAQHAANSTFAALLPSLRSIHSSQDGLEEQTQLVIGYRLPPGYDIAGLQAQLALWAGEEEAILTFSGEEEAFQTMRTTPLARAFIAAVRACSGGQPTHGDLAKSPSPSHSGTAGTKSSSFKYKTGTSDMNVVGPIWGQNILAYGPGDGRLDHTPDEHLRIAEYMQAIDVLEWVLRELAIQGGTM